MKRYALYSTALLIGLSACSSSAPVVTPKTYKVASRQYAPDPVYNRVRWVFPPESLPSRTEPRMAEEYVMPVFRYEVKNVSIEEASQILAGAMKYRCYTSGVVADKRVSLRTVGTVDEVAGQLETQAGVRVVIDHQNRDLRVFAKNEDPVKPRLFEGRRVIEEKVTHEHQSTD